MLILLFQVPHTTLCDRINGRCGRRKAHQSQQLLSDPQEEVLCDWIDFRALIAKPLDIQDIQCLTAELSGNTPGKHWIRRFMKRWPQVSHSRPGGLDPKRAQNFNPSNVAGFYQLLRAIYDAYPDLPPQHVWNMDEKGLQLGGGRKRSKKFFRLKSLKQSKFYQIRSDNLELVTIIECISPAGLSIPPAFILAQGPTPALPDLDVPIGAVSISPNGWTNNELGLKWFQETFIPFASAHKINDAPILLLVDGHDSHETDDLRKIAYEHNIFILAFPSKCTHKLQPLDVTVFAQLQRKWSAHCDRRIYENIAMNRYNVIPEYMEVCAASMTPELIHSAFSCTGIHPFNPQVFTDEDFAPARSFSTIPQVPRSFPADVRSSSPIPSDVSDSTSSDLDLGGDEFEDQSDTEADVHPLYMDWDTDSDSAYEPPSSHVSPSSSSSSLSSSSSSSHAPPAIPSLYISLPSLSTASMSPMLDTPSVPAEHHDAMSTRSVAGPSVPSDGLSVNTNAAKPNFPHHFTRSQNTTSSSTMSISTVLDYMHTPVPNSEEELSAEVTQLQMTCQLLTKELSLSRAMLEASNAHCTIMKRAESDARERLLSKKGKSRRTVKTVARYVAHDTLKEIHTTQIQERATRAREAAEKEAQKAEEEATRLARIREETRMRIFTGV